VYLPAELIARTVGSQHTVPEILAASAAVCRDILGVDSAFVAMAGAAGQYHMSITEGIRDPRFREIRVRAGAGLGGQVLLLGRPHRVADYAHDPTISRDFVHVVCDLEGLSGMACVPVDAGDSVQALLYTATRTVGPPGDRTLRTMELVATHAVLALQQVAIRNQEIELAVLRERQRLANHLHDSVAQMLFAIGVAAHYAREQQDPAVLAAALDEIDATAADARSELRTALHRLSQPPQGLAFEARLAGDVRLFAEATGCRVRIIRRGERRDLPQPVEDLLIDTALEGLRNTVKYAHATLAVVHLMYRPDEVTLVLQAEFPTVPPPAAGAGSGTGAGLALLRRRAQQLRGALHLTDDSAGHKVLRLELPAHSVWGGEP
jgi:signal transduction histidine kinase